MDPTEAIPDPVIFADVMMRCNGTTWRGSKLTVRTNTLARAARIGMYLIEEG
jgi:hypothetical protein